MENKIGGIGFQERWMLVSMSGEEFFKRKVFAKKDGKFLAWSGADTDEEVAISTGCAGWKYAKEIEETRDIEITLEEIAEKFGVSVEYIKIKK
jgi:hypothetical protein